MVMLLCPLRRARSASIRFRYQTRLATRSRSWAQRNNSKSHPGLQRQSPALPRVNSVSARLGKIQSISRKRGEQQRFVFFRISPKYRPLTLPNLKWIGVNTEYLTAVQVTTTKNNRPTTIATSIEVSVATATAASNGEAVGDVSVVLSPAVVNKLITLAEEVCGKKRKRQNGAGSCAYEFAQRASAPGGPFMVDIDIGIPTLSLSTVSAIVAGVSGPLAQKLAGLSVLALVAWQQTGSIPNIIKVPVSDVSKATDQPSPTTATATPTTSSSSSSPCPTGKDIVRTFCFSPRKGADNIKANLSRRSKLQGGQLQMYRRELPLFLSIRIDTINNY